jgi:hypothetical protein
MARVIPPRRSSMARSAVVLLAFLALAIQTLVVQTHVHRAGEQGIISVLATDQTAKADPSGKTPVDKFPANEDPVNCPLCQEFHHSGAFVSPTAAVLALPFYVHLSLIVFNQPVIAVRALSHSWQGRAPPKA